MYAIAFDLKIDDLKKNYGDSITGLMMKFDRNWRYWVLNGHRAVYM